MPVHRLVIHHVASGFEWFADIADHFVDLFHHMLVENDTVVLKFMPRFRPSRISAMLWSM